MVDHAGLSMVDHGVHETKQSCKYAWPFNKSWSTIGIIHGNSMIVHGHLIDHHFCLRILMAEIMTMFTNSGYYNFLYLIFLSSLAITV